MRNLGAYHLGLDPNNAANQYRCNNAGLVVANEELRMHPRSLEVTTDQAGQVDVRPKYEVSGEVSVRRCPATYAKVAAEQGKRSGLSVFMHTVGDVALANIYPRQFAIVDPTPASAYTGRP